MASPQVHGDIPNPTHSSLFIQHLLNYPVISDGVHTFKSNQYGQKTFKLGDAAYQTFAAPVLPWFAKPYEYVLPCVQKVDSLGDKTLDRLDKRFPVVKKPTNDLYNETKGLILISYTKGLEGKDYVLEVYNAEYKKNEQAGLVAHGKAAVTTVLVVSNETLTWLSSFLHAKNAEATQAVNDKINQ
ncbi:hypothetical protein BKA56DRAFT_637569 [Ilyonectria sp. MPI-CAGE-AT-0026]|nr:hypothetical protein BKA56DRAFT_637569 [Ilyonectria sp. MPI-CAGE-AT-0026]